jgi:hypothetical protein
MSLSLSRRLVLLSCRPLLLYCPLSSSQSGRIVHCRWAGEVARSLLGWCHSVTTLLCSGGWGWLGGVNGWCIAWAMMAGWGFVS